MCSVPHSARFSIYRLILTLFYHSRFCLLLPFILEPKAFNCKFTYAWGHLTVKHGFLYWPLTSVSKFAVELFHVVHETP